MTTIESNICAIHIDFYFLQVDLASCLTRVALELIGQAGIGHSFDTFQEDGPTHPYAKAASGFMWVCFVTTNEYITDEER